MGAHLKFKVENPENAAAVNEWLTDQPETDVLKELEYGQRLYFTEDPQEYGPDQGEGEVKPSALTRDEKTEAKQAWVSLFTKLHTHDDFTVKVLASSCALRLMTFSLQQLNDLTNNGDALSGPAANQYQRMLDKATGTPSNHAFTKLATPGVAAVLDYFIRDPDQHAMQDEICEAVSENESTVETALSVLTTLGILTEPVPHEYVILSDTPKLTPALHDIHQSLPASATSVFQTLFADEGMVEVLNAFLIFETETFRPDMVTEYTSLDEPAVADRCEALTDLDVLTVSMDSFYRLNRDHDATQALLTIHTALHAQ